MTKIFLSLTIISLCAVSLISCAPAVDSVISAPEIVLSSTQNEATTPGGSSIEVEQVVDARPAKSDDSASSYFTEPGDDATTAVEDALRKAMAKRATASTSNNPLRLRTKIKKWRTNYKADVNGAINSEAALMVELVDPAGQVIYTGEYEGMRSSEFIVVTVGDLQQSLGLAMGKAIDEMLNDADFARNISSAEIR